MHGAWVHERYLQVTFPSCFWPRWRWWRRLRETSKKVKQYERITGVIHRVPSNGVGLWMVGSRTFEADSFTSFNTFEASMTAGNCAIVLLRQTRAVQIVLLRQGDC